MNQQIERESLPSCIVFGSLSTWPSEQELGLVHDTLLKQHRDGPQPIVEALRSLPHLWDQLVSRHAGLERLASGRDAADQLARWASSATGEKKLPRGVQRQPMLSGLAMPVTVLRHFSQYVKFLNHLVLEDESSGSTHAAVLEMLNTPGGGGIQGFCVGLLSALATAGAPDDEALAINAALAIRLAFAVGVFVDLDALEAGATTCLAVRWRAPMSLDGVAEVLAKHEGAYISVLKDTHDASITVPATSVAALKKDLAGSGILAVDTGLGGRYHFPPLERAVEPILEACGVLGPTSFGPLRVLVRSNDDGNNMDNGDSSAHARAALRSILAHRCDWTSVMAPVAEALRSVAAAGRPGAFIQSFGTDAVPLSVSRDIKVVKAAEATVGSQDRPPEQPQYPAGAIAVVGMSCKFPGVDSVDEFWQMLLDGRSAVEPISPSRWTEDMSTRAGLNKTQPRWWANLMRDIDAFDHRFFKKSAREAASMDPQQRLLLEATYEAMASAGYFANPSRPHDVGVYIGMSGADYDANVGSHAANAFSTLGTLRAFISGKLSHFFGWTSPSLTIDTACSSSAVAIHTACQAIRSGECSRAVAGGVNLLTAPYVHENLAAAHFLSPTGACKPFDAGADGYCRGEGVGLVVLKELAAAREDGNEILAVIGASGVNQNRGASGNSAPIAVPVAGSQRQLFEAVTARAGVAPSQVSLVEAHGTGTPVGDPIEMESIRAVFGSRRLRDGKPLYVSSVKGAIGHLEGASGVAGLIRVILQMEKRTATVQASFRSLNPKIAALEPDGIVIPTHNVRLPEGGLLTACVNNYGAAGSNAALIVMQPPHGPPKVPANASKQPILVAAHTPESLSAYCHALADQLRAHDDKKDGYDLPSLAYSLARRQNQELPSALMTTASDVNDLEMQLRQRAAEQRPSRAPPLVLAFGGQVRDHVGLDKDFWEQSALFRFHLDQCDETLRSLGNSSSLLYPGVFSSEPVPDIPALHAMVFSVQYASAKAWLDSGLVVDALIGHSLGQLTALCVSGALSLADGLRLVVGRAELMGAHWGSERGAMLAVEAAEDTIQRLLAGRRDALEVACYNGPTSHVLVGSVAAVDALQRHLADEGVLRARRLAVTHGFHSRLADGVVPSLERLARGLSSLREPQMRLETCSPDASWPAVTPALVARHTREPVHFAQAVRRLADSLGGGCTWLEAGSGSGVAAMVRRALDDDDKHKNHAFQPMVLGRGGGVGGGNKEEPLLDALADATVHLWRRGHQVRFWGFHPRQRAQYDFVRLPPYSFDKTRHWLDLVPPRHDAAAVPPPHLDARGAEALAQGQSLPPELITFEAPSDDGATFAVNPRCDEYVRFVAGHVVAGAPLCPATAYVELAVRAASQVSTAPAPAPASTPTGFSVHDLRIESPLGLAADRRVTLRLRRLVTSRSGWAFDVSSSQLLQLDAGGGGGGVSVHATGHVVLHEDREDAAAVGDELGRFERLVDLGAVDGMLYATGEDDGEGDKAAESVQGSVVYRLFSRVVEYDPVYRGIRRVAVARARGEKQTQTAAGTVTVTLSEDDAMFRVNKATLTLPSVVDAFIQLSGVHANVFDEGCGEGNVFVMTSLGRLVCGPGFTLADAGGQGGGGDGDRLGRVKKRTWKIWLTSSSSRPGDKERAHDLFVYDAAAGRIVVLILGARFTRVSLSSLSRVLSHVNTTSTNAERSPRPHVARSALAPAPPPARVQQADTVDLDRSGAGAVFKAVCELVERVAEVPRHQIKGNVSLDDVGIDSLMLMEVFSEMEAHFDVQLPLEALANMADVDALVHYLVQQGASPSALEDDLLPSEDADVSSTSTEPASSTDLSSSSPSLDAKPTTTTVVDRLAALLQSHLELASPPTLHDNLVGLGLDSLLCIELASDVQEAFGVELDVNQLVETSTFADLVKLVDTLPSATVTSAKTRTASKNPAAGDALSTKVNTKVNGPPSSSSAAHIFDDIRLGFDQYVNDEGFTAFWTNVYPHQAALVLSYVGQAYKQLGVDLSSMAGSATIPPLPGVLPKHKLLVRQLHRILAAAGYVVQDNEQDEDHYTRTIKPFDLAPPETLLADITLRFPLHAAEHRLLDVTGSRLATCMTGRIEPLQLLFANKAHRTLLADVYEGGPMFRAATRFLATYLTRSLSPWAAAGPEPVHILEVGAGTGGTTRYLVDHLARAGVAFTYTFTDISAALVSQARAKFAASSPEIKDRMRYATLDCERPPPPELAGRYDVVVSTNCVHATPDVGAAARNIRLLLRPGGFLALVEFTRNLFWFDLVFGLLDGWWYFADGRDHALAPPAFWDKALRGAGFSHVSFSGGDTDEARTLSVICAFNAGPGIYAPAAPPSSATPSRRAGLPVETVAWKNVDGVELLADVYYPAEADAPGAPKRPVALLLHGGGYVACTRQDIPARHIKRLLGLGLLPVSVDYRLCPEVSLEAGALVDAVGAIAWARGPSLASSSSQAAQHVDPDRLAVVGWSVGGHLGMTAVAACARAGVRPPDAVVAFYAPSDFEDDWWKFPIYPACIAETPEPGYEEELLEGVGDKPLAGYAPPSNRNRPGMFMTLRDPRWRICVHMNWAAQMVPILVHGLPSRSQAKAKAKAKALAVAKGNNGADSLDGDEGSNEHPRHHWTRLPWPTPAQVRAISPRAHVDAGAYRVPTFLVHGALDDMIPARQTADTVAALQARGVDAEVAVVVGVGHGFDLTPGADPRGEGWEAVERAYAFLRRHVST